MKQVRATRYVTPLREGGSLPGIVEGDDLGTYVCKFRGAGQGVRVLVAEVVVGELARRIGLRTPQLVALDLDPDIARYEADEEVQDLLNASPGLNLGVDFLPSAFGFDGELPTGAAGAAQGAVAGRLHRKRRPLLAQPQPALLARRSLGDRHGAALYFHHAWSGGVTDPARFAAQPWSPADHVFGDRVAELPEVDAELAALLDERVLTDISGRGARRVARSGARCGDARCRTRRLRVVPRGPPRPTSSVAASGGRDMSKLAYQYVVLRCVPRVDREEFVNVGVVLYCHATDFLDVSWRVDRDRLQAFDPGLDVDQVCDGLEFIDAVCRADPAAGSVATKDPGTRFGFLKAPRSTVVQPGPVHGGLADDPSAELDRLLGALVG